jgi:two-component system, NtrC family, sensor kinase
MPSKHYSQLRFKIIAVTLVFSLVPLLVLGVTIYQQFSRAYTNKVGETLRTLVSNRRSSLELFFSERLSQMTTVVNTQTLGQLTDEAYLKYVFDTIQARSQSYIDLGVIDQEGRHLAYVGPHYDKLKNVNYGHEDWFNAVMSSGVYVSDVFLGFRKVPHFIIAVRRIEGSKTWILRATINSDILEGIVRAGQLGKYGDAYIINRQNILQTTPRFSGRLLEKPKGPDFSHAIGTSMERLDTQEGEFLFATSQLLYPQWVVVVREDPSEQMAPLFEAQYLEAIVVVLGVVFVVVGTLFITRSMINALIRMEHEKASSDEMCLQSAKMAALGKLAAGVAHEINNPLQIIGDQAGWMKDLLEEEDVRRSPNFQEFEGCINKILRHLERCRSVTHRLLRFGRRMEPTQEAVDMNAVVSETITFLENEAKYRGIEVVTDFEEKLPRITTDQTQIQQVLLNIIDNALDAVGRDGMVSIKTSFPDPSLREVAVSISDTGPGMSKEMLNRIFDPFFTTKPTGEGTGLGLSISYSIVEKLGGRIQVSSDMGKGTTFTIFLPVGDLNG